MSVKMSIFLVALLLVSGSAHADYASEKEYNDQVGRQDEQNQRDYSEHLQQIEAYQPPDSSRDTYHNYDSGQDYRPAPGAYDPNPPPNYGYR